MNHLPLPVPTGERTPVPLSYGQLTEVSTANPLSVVIDGVADRMCAAWVDVQSRMSAHSWDVAERWDQLSNRRRWIARAAGYMSLTAVSTVAVIAGRATGAAAHGLEGVDVLNHLPEAPKVELPKRSQVVPLAQKDESDIVLPRYADNRPDAVKLDNYRNDNEDGSVWGRVEQYAEKLGYDPSGRALYKVVDATLEDRGLTWKEAEDLPVGYKLQLLAPERMEAVLEDAGVRRTAPAPVFEPAPDTDKPPVDPVVPAPSSSAAAQPPVNDTGENLSDGRLDGPTLVAMGIMGTAAVGAAAYAVRQRRARIAAEDALARQAGGTGGVVPVPIIAPRPAGAQPPDPAVRQTGHAPLIGPAPEERSRLQRLWDEYRPRRKKKRAAGTAHADDSSS